MTPKSAFPAFPVHDVDLAKSWLCKCSNWKFVGDIRNLRKYGPLAEDITGSNVQAFVPIAYDAIKDAIGDEDSSAGAVRHGGNKRLLERLTKVISENIMAQQKTKDRVPWVNDVLPWLNAYIAAHLKDLIRKWKGRQSG